MFENPNIGIILDLHGSRLINFKHSKKKKRLNKEKGEKKEEEEVEVR